MPWNTHTVPPPHIHTQKIDNEIEKEGYCRSREEGRLQAAELTTVYRSKWIAVWFRERKRKTGNVSP